MSWLLTHECWHRVLCHGCQHKSATVQFCVLIASAEIARYCRNIEFYVMVVSIRVLQYSSVSRLRALK